ncbi:hypothetical protein [Halopseudomonas pelagia]|uniref:Uncharacterized protein n=1 Tax=Halopseudomonas pelagia TaxID=553151 RepID=A0AA91U261_9GAMM|nr:hypothetical protein [Halopseudomonas pelagia]PCC98991.1 hypothetical protein CO192_12605 [Halopseudomonas pelagia]QFY55416.1 hypothetical protein EAO82_02885 [Halopseudomonas pelagia]
MEKQRLKINLPPIRDDASGYKYLSKLSDQLISNPQHFYTFDFSKCSTMSHNGLAVIGGVCNYLKRHELQTPFFSMFSDKKIGFSLDGMSPRLQSRLQELGFWNYVQPDHGVVGGNDYIGYREHEEVLKDFEIINHLQDSWLTNEKLSLSTSLKNEIVSSIYEIFVNAYGHGLKENLNNQSVISCGYYEAKEKRLSLSVLDFGGGVVRSVQKCFPNVAKEEAFRWALEVGNSTRTDSPADIPRGLGFGLLKDFILVNGGVLRVCSDGYMATVSDNGSYVTQSMPGHFFGTLVSITVNCDGKHYKLRSEVASAPSYF